MARDAWEASPDRTSRRLRAHTKPGSLDGRVSQYQPLPSYDGTRYPGGESQVYVQPDEPDDDTIGALWFDTDEPVY